MEEMIEQCTQMMNGMSGMMGSGMMGGMMGGMTSGAWWVSPWYWLGWVWLLTVLTLIVIALIWAIRRVGRSAPGTETPLDILKRRFARGEITPDQ